MVARNKGVDLPDGALTGSDGSPTNDPNALYEKPSAVMNSMGAHKGSGLAIMADLLAGSLGGGGCAQPGVAGLANGMLSILIDPNVFTDASFVQTETTRFTDWVRSARPADPAKQCYCLAIPSATHEWKERKMEYRWMRQPGV